MPIAIAVVARFSLCTKAIASRVRAPSRTTLVHLAQVIRDSLTMMRCRRASRAVSSAPTISRCATFWPSDCGREREIEMERLGERRRYDRERRVLTGHGRPFFVHRLLDMPTHERAHPGLGPSGEGGAEEDHGTQGTRLAIDRRLRLADVVPDLRREEPDDQAEDQAQRREHSRRHAFERARPFADGKRQHRPRDRGREEIGRGEHEDHEPGKGQVVQPVDHGPRNTSATQVRPVTRP